MTGHHIPVLLKESLDYLVTKKNGIYFDATIGFGGHTSELLKRLNSQARVIATDVDEDAFNYSKQRFISEPRVSIYKFNFSMVDIVAKIESIEGYDGIIADLGVSSFQLDNKASGFTYRENTNLDLRLDKSLKITAADVLNELDEKELTNIFWNYGEEKNSRKIARLIVEKRKDKRINSTFQLNEIVSQVTPINYLAKSLSRIYQALRIYVNDELTTLKDFINNGIKVLKSGGRFVIITYHSLEDRIVKELFTNHSQKQYDKKVDPFGIKTPEPSLKVITKKPVVPTEDEIQVNKRARSAKLRVAEKL
jgi:16S rRNA (cytosine1402-N4)-methyltransferase